MLLQSWAALMYVLQSRTSIIAKRDSFLYFKAGQVVWQGKARVTNYSKLSYKMQNLPPDVFY